MSEIPEQEPPPLQQTLQEEKSCGNEEQETGPENSNNSNSGLNNNIVSDKKIEPETPPANNQGRDSKFSEHSTTTGTPQPEQDNVRVFVGSLAWEVNDSDLRRRFSAFGEVREAVVVRDKSNGFSKGYGFVTYFSTDSAARAVRSMAHESIGGRPVRIEFAEVRYKPRRRESDYWRPTEHGPPQDVDTGYFTRERERAHDYDHQNTSREHNWRTRDEYVLTTRERIRDDFGSNREGARVHENVHDDYNFTKEREHDKEWSVHSDDRKAKESVKMEQVPTPDDLQHKEAIIDKQKHVKVEGDNKSRKEELISSHSLPENLGMHESYRSQEPRHDIESSPWYNSQNKPRGREHYINERDSGFDRNRGREFDRARLPPGPEREYERMRGKEVWQFQNPDRDRERERQREREREREREIIRERTRLRERELLERERVRDSPRYHDYTRESDRARTTKYPEYPREPGYPRAPYTEYGRHADRNLAPYYDYTREHEFRAREVIERERARDYDIRGRERYRGPEFDSYRRSPPITGSLSALRDTTTRHHDVDYYYSNAPRPSRRSLSPRSRHPVRRSISPRARHPLRRPHSPGRSLPVAPHDDRYDRNVVRSPENRREHDYYPAYRNQRYDRYVPTTSAALPSSSGSKIYEDNATTTARTNGGTYDDSYIGSRGREDRSSRHWDAEMNDARNEVDIIRSNGSTSTIVASSSGPFETNVDPPREVEYRYWDLDGGKERNTIGSDHGSHNAAR